MAPALLAMRSPSTEGRKRQPRRPVTKTDRSGLIEPKAAGFSTGGASRPPPDRKLAGGMAYRSVGSPVAASAIKEPLR